jgi:hypothetical protein
VSGMTMPAMRCVDAAVTVDPFGWM